MNNYLLPNAIIIGAPKAGTTSLFNILKQHQQVYCSPIKEPRFFNNDDNYSNGIEWYQQKYFHNAQGYPIRIDATPAYLTWGEKVAPRMKEALGEGIKLIAVFRDPVQRAYSHYWHHVRLGHETLSFSQAIALEDQRLRERWDELYTKGDGRYGYFRAGCYAKSLQPFLKLFSRDCFMFILHEDLINDFSPTITRLLNYLDIDSSIQLSLVKDNVAAMPRNILLNRLYKRLIKLASVRVFDRKIFSEQFRHPIRRKIENLLNLPVKYPPMDPEVADSLRSRYAEEVRALEKIINRDLSHWI